MEGVLLSLAYDGTRYAGWAPQKNAPTVAGALLEAVQKMRPGVASLRGASRTDAGVHARGQRVSFDADEGIGSHGWVKGLNGYLPPDIAVRAASKVEAGYDPRRHGAGKRYIYTLLLDPVRDPFLDGYAYRVVAPLDLARMRAEAPSLLGTHNFEAFRASADERTDTIRTIRRLDLLADPADPRVVRLLVEGDRFMYNMVRIIAGSLVDVGSGRLDAGAFARALASGRRTDLGQTAPAHGLLLDEVFLDDEGTARWPALPGAGS